MSDQTILQEAAIHSGAGHFYGPDQPGYDLYSACIHCGLCLNACPTYRVLGQEMDSPRGRIYQIAQVDQGRMELGSEFVTHIDRCLDCRACETACPSGVQYGKIVERARAQIAAHYTRPWLARTLRDFGYKTVLADFGKLAALARLLRLYQRSGMQAMVRKSGILKLLGLTGVEALTPEIKGRFSFDDLGRTFPAEGERRGKVILLVGCVGSVAFSDLNQATIRVLVKNGLDVHIDSGQGCCGALHAHAGYRETARTLAKRNIDACLGAPLDGQGINAFLTNSAGCGSTLKEYHDLLEHDSEYRDKALQFAAKVRDVTEYLAHIGLRSPAQPLNARVTYQDPCHLAHGQRVRSAPRELLRQAGAQLVEMPHSDGCCGSAGTYNLTQNELSMQILDRKMDDVQTVSADILATANTGCMLQLRAGVQKRGLKLPVKHVIEILDGSY